MVMCLVGLEMMVGLLEMVVGLLEMVVVVIN